MSFNVLEELVREYYEYKGYFIKSNVRFNKLQTGGYKGEIDILAYNPEVEEMLHIECSMDAKSKEDESKMAEKKFPVDLDYKKLFPFKFKEVRKIYILGQSKEQSEIKMLEGIEVKNLGPFIREVYEEIEKDIFKKIVPEAYPLLRTMQLTKWAKSRAIDKK